MPTLIVANSELGISSAERVAGLVGSNILTEVKYTHLRDTNVARISAARPSTLVVYVSSADTPDEAAACVSFLCEVRAAWPDAYIIGAGQPQSVRDQLADAGADLVTSALELANALIARVHTGSIG